MSGDLRDANVEQAQTVELIRAKDRLTDAIADYAVASQTATAANRGRADEKWSCVIETRDALISAVQAQAREAWQPMATAPRDRRWLLGWHEDFGHFVFRDGPGLLTGEDPMPTHWMPLPEPPK